MQYASLFPAVTCPVASRARQGTAAAAARAARNAGQPILVASACKIALQSRGDLPEQPTILPTSEEVRVSIPEQGIMVHELFQLFISRISSAESFTAFAATFQAVAAQDPVTQLVFPMTDTSTAQTPSSFASRLIPDASSRGPGCTALVGIMQASPVEVDAELVAIAWRRGTLRSSRLAESFPQ